MAEALTAWAEGTASPETRQALASAALSYLLETLGILAGERLGLEGLNACTFGAWLAAGITGCEPLLESPGMLAALDRIATQALWGTPRPMRHAREDVAFCRDYRLAVPAVVAALCVPGPSEDRTPGVLFLCTHNAARSQIAEALLRHYAGDRFEVFSAGLEPTEVHPFARRVLSEIGLDACELWAKGLEEFLGRVRIHYATIVCDEDQPCCPRTYPSALHVLHWPFEDPTQAKGSREERLQAFRQVRDQIGAQLRGWLRDMAVP